MTETHKSTEPTFRRIGDKPLIVPSNADWEAGGTFAPAVTRSNDKFRMLYRAYGTDSISRLGYAESADGINWIKSGQPRVEPKKRAESAGIEDPRIISLNGRFYVSYTAVRGKIGRLHTRVGILETTDFSRFNHIITKIQGQWTRNDKDAVLFPKIIDGRYRMLHRIPPNIEISTSKDLINWRGPRTVLRPTQQKWEELKVGSGPPPILCEMGWLLFYHGVSNSDIYSMGAAILDINEPGRVLYRLPYPILTPERYYEKEGVVPNVVFGTSALEIDDSYWMYYGAADRVIGAATINKQALLAALLRQPIER